MEYVQFGGNKLVMLTLFHFSEMCSESETIILCLVAVKFLCVDHIKFELFSLLIYF